MKERSLKFTVVIPCYCASETIRSCIDSIVLAANIAKEKVQILIVDDGSTDSSYEIIQKICKEQEGNNFLSFEVARQKNSGPGVARNYGIDHALGEYILFLDADDVVLQNYFVKLKEKCNGDADVVFFSYQIYDINLKQRVELDNRNKNIYESCPLGLFSSEDYPQILETIGYPWNKAYRRDYLIENRIYFPSLHLQEDFPFFIDATVTAKSISYIPNDLMVYHVGSVSSASQRRGLKRMDCIRAVEMSIEKNSNLSCGERKYLILSSIDLLIYYHSVEAGVVRNELKKAIEKLVFKMQPSFFFELVDHYRKTGRGWVGRVLNQIYIDTNYQTYLQDKVTRGEIKLSIVVPMYNTEAFIAESLNSLYNQNLNKSNYEVIVVDNNSTDRSYEIAKDFCRNKENFKVVKVKEGLPCCCGSSTNTGIDLAVGEFVGLLDSDDIVDSTAFAKLLFMGLIANADIVVTGFTEFPNETNFNYPGYDFVNWETAIANYFEGNQEQVLKILLAQCGSVPWRKLYRRTYLNRYNIRYPQGEFTFEDNPFHWSSLMHTTNVVLLEAWPFHHRTNRPGQSIMSSTENRFAISAHAFSILAELRESGLLKRYKIEYINWLNTHLFWTLSVNLSSSKSTGFYKKMKECLSFVSIKDLLKWRISYFIPFERFIFVLSMRLNCSYGFALYAFYFARKVALLKRLFHSYILKSNRKNMLLD